MMPALLKLAHRGVQAFRLDAIARQWKRAGGACMKQPEVHLILEAMRTLDAIVAPGECAAPGAACLSVIAA